MARKSYAADKGPTRDTGPPRARAIKVGTAADGFNYRQSGLPPDVSVYQRVLNQAIPRTAMDFCGECGVPASKCGGHYRSPVQGLRDGAKVSPAKRPQGDPFTLGR